MKQKISRTIKYNSILNETQGEDYLINEEIIKEEQCCNCIKRGKLKQCRLEIDNLRCINYEKVDKR